MFGSLFPKGMQSMAIGDGSMEGPDCEFFCSRELKSPTRLHALTQVLSSFCRLTNSFL